MFRKHKSSAMDQTNVERVDRMDADSHGDGMAGSEGIDEPSMHEHNRMSTSDRGKSGGSRQQGREGSTDDASTFSGQGNQRENSMDRSEGTGYTGNRGNMKGRDDRLESERSTTGNSESENPLV